MKKKNMKTLGLAMVLLLNSFCAQTFALTMEGAVETALSNNHLIKEKNNRVKEMRERIENSAYNPTLDAIDYSLV